MLPTFILFITKVTSFILLNVSDVATFSLYSVASYLRRCRSREVRVFTTTTTTSTAISSRKEKKSCCSKLLSGVDGPLGRTTFYYIFHT